MSINVTSAIQAYQNAAKMPAVKSESSSDALNSAAEGFKGLVTNTIGNLRATEDATAGFMAKKVSTTDLVTAISQADLQLQTFVSVRDRFVSAIQEIMRMPI